jgi:hypothetical protein
MVDEDALASLLKEHYERRPLMRATDFYKLLYQGVFGVGHIMGGAARSRLQEEAERINPEDHPEDPFTESVSADGEILRVNLRPYIRRGLDLDELFGVMVESAKDEGDPEEFREAWGVFMELVDAGEIEVEADEIGELVEELDTSGPYPHHHSPEYNEAYYPAYRVVRRELLPGLFS